MSDLPRPWLRDELRALSQVGDGYTVRDPGAHIAQMAGELLELRDRVTTLVTSCADKDASIADLIEQLQKAEAQLAGSKPVDVVFPKDKPFRTEAHE